MKRMLIPVVVVVIAIACAHRPPQSIEYELTGREVERPAGAWGGPCLADGGCSVGMCTEWTVELTGSRGRTCELRCDVWHPECPRDTTCRGQAIFDGVDMVPICVPDDGRWDPACLDGGTPGSRFRCDDRGAPGVRLRACPLVAR